MTNTPIAAKLATALRNLRDANKKVFYEHGPLILAADEALAEYDTAKDSAAGEQWRPIETAPKDNTRIIVEDDGDVRIAWWIDSGFWVAISPRRSIVGLVRIYPKRWIPLPPHSSAGGAG